MTEHRWVHCTPALLAGGVDCATHIRTDCRCPGGGGHDHLVPVEVKPGDEWCDDHDDYEVNCGCNDEDRAESRREFEDEQKWMQGPAYDHNRGVCDGPGCCRFCDGREGDPMPFVGPVGEA